MHTAYIALGANLGDRSKNIHAALHQLAQIPKIQINKVSALIENPAIGGPPDSPPFLNGAAEIQTTLTPHELLHSLLQIEQSLGRHRTEKWSPRTIDLDLLLYENQIINDPDLKLPHPLLYQRQFVLEPLSQIAPNALHPTQNKTIQQLLASLKQRTTDNGQQTPL